MTHFQFVYPGSILAAMQQWRLFVQATAATVATIDVAVANADLLAKIVVATTFQLNNSVIP